MTWSLRVNVLEQCQYRCLYCLPRSLTAFTAASRHLRAEEYGLLARAFSAFDVHKVRFTGGEPLLREDLPDIADAFRAALPDAELAVTTNGQLLAGKLDALVASGIERVTVHVDSLRPERYRKLMGVGDLDRILRSVLEARERLREVKLNTVVQGGENDDEVVELLEWSRRTGVELRFIELMNTGSAEAHARTFFVSGAEIVTQARALGPVVPLPRRDVHDPAALFCAGNGVVFGVIAPQTQPFCGACNRLRLTPSGRLSRCPYDRGAVELGRALRDGATEDELRRLIALGRRTRVWRPFTL